MKCAARGSLEIQDAKMTQKSPSTHHRTTLWRWIFATKACIDNRKKNLLNNSISSTCPTVAYGELRPSSGWDRFGSLGHPTKFQWGFAFWLRYCSDVVYRRLTKLCTMLGRLLGSYTIIYIFGGSCPLMEFCHQRAKFTLRPSLAFSYIGSVLHGTPAAW